MIALRQPDKNMNQSISARYRFPPIFSDSTSSPGLPISGSTSLVISLTAI